MPPRLRGPLAPQCPSCLQRCLDASFGINSPPIRQQVRGKKVYTAPWHQPESTVVVKLTKFVYRWGKRGTYLPAPAGLVRNKWLPQRMARYVVGEELKQLYERGATIQRDTQAGVNVGQKNKRTQDLEDSVGRAWTEESEERARAGETSTDTAPTVAIEHVEPDRAIQLLDALLPSKLDFERAVRRQDTKKGNEEAGKQAVRHDMIYGSLSIGDIVDSIRLAVSHNDEAARILVSDLDVKFLDLPEGENPTRVRRLGSFTVEIGQKGTERILKRTVNIIKEGETPITEASTTKLSDLGSVLNTESARALAPGLADDAAKSPPEEKRADL